MCFRARVLLALGWLLTGGGGAAFGQNAPTSSILQLPSGPSHDRPVKPPTAAPRQPVHQIEGASQREIPVIPPHGPIHAHKPAGAAAPPPGKVSPVPPATVPTQPQADIKTAQPDKVPDPERPNGSIVNLPRFASLRSDDVNMRAGPGTRYRIDWVYKRRDLPVEIEREFDVWRWVRDVDGIQGWVHQATLMGRRSFIVQKTDAILRSDAKDSAPAVAILKPGVIGRIRSCEASSDWCDVQVGSYHGYLRREQFWGVLPDEAVNP